MSEIDWTAELKKIEREFDGLPPQPSPSAARARRQAEQSEAERREELNLALGASVRLLLVLMLGIAIIFWPFARACGTGLMAYLGATAVIILGGLWSSAWTWRARIGSAHALAVVVFIWGMALAAAEVLPRIGYARIDPQHPPTLWCQGANPGAAVGRFRSR
jgi:hypothetical protein